MPRRNFRWSIECVRAKEGDTAADRWRGSSFALRCLPAFRFFGILTLR
jgi:hypothetical protein